MIMEKSSITLSPIKYECPVCGFRTRREMIDLTCPDCGNMMRDMSNQYLKQDGL